VLLALAVVVAAMVVPYSVVQDVLRKFTWIGHAVDFLDTVAPGLEVSHLLAFGALGGLARFAWSRSRARSIAGAIVAVAVLVEVVQHWVPGRESAISHAVLEALGGLAGFGIAWVLSYAWGSASLPPEYQASTHWSGEHSDR
jgi:VanZ family protein